MMKEEEIMTDWDAVRQRLRQTRDRQMVAKSCGCPEVAETALHCVRLRETIGTGCPCRCHGHGKSEAELRRAMLLVRGAMGK